LREVVAEIPKTRRVDKKQARGGPGPLCTALLSPPTSVPMQISTSVGVVQDIRHLLGWILRRIGVADSDLKTRCPTSNSPPLGWTFFLKRVGGRNAASGWCTSVPTGTIQLGARAGGFLCAFTSRRAGTMRSARFAKSPDRRSDPSGALLFVRHLRDEPANRGGGCVARSWHSGEARAARIAGPGGSTHASASKGW
jgi:hypothetical protein